MSGIYIHIPFCRRKCYYCDFYSVGARRAPWEALVTALLGELRDRRQECPGTPATLYIGGGTPSLLPPSQMERLVTGVRAICGQGAGSREFTVEVNPDDVTPGLVELYRSLGVNRVSVGVQSFIDSELEAVGRRHTAAQARQACGQLRQIGNLSLDLMFGLPGQTLASWATSLREALNLRPEHISAYSLMWEEGTALSLMRRQGRVIEAPEGVSVEMYELLCRELKKAGYCHYEISNYALPGRESRHNSSYWRQEPYLGIGPGAHSYDGARLRRANPCDIAAYISRFSGSAGTDPFYTQELLSVQELRDEYVMTRMRTSSGIEYDDYLAHFGNEATERLRRRAARQAALGNVSDSNGRLCLSAQGVMTLDTVLVELMS